MISVVIPTYNRADDLFNCLTSLVDQTFKSFEVIVIDDGSTDGTSRVCKQFSSDLSLKYILLPQCSGGPAFPRNIGISNSSFNWIAFLDSDDIWSSNKLLKIVNEIELNPDVQLLFHKFKGIESKYIIKPIFLLDQLFRSGNIIVNSSVVVSKIILAELNGFDTNSKLISAEDYDLWIRIAFKTDKFKYIDEVLGTYTYTVDSISLNYGRKLTNFLFLFKKHKRIYFSNILYLVVFVRTIIKHSLLYIKQWYEKLY